MKTGSSVFIALTGLLVSICVVRSEPFSLQPISAVSRLTHGGAGTFDISLPLAGPRPGIECRAGHPPGSYQIVITFRRSITFDSVRLTNALGGTVARTSSDAATIVTLNLSGVATGQTITVELLGVTDGHSASDVRISMSVIVGDTDGNGIVNSTDVAQTRARNGSSTTAANFRTDVNGNGVINATDTAIVKGRLGMGLPDTRFSFTLDSQYQTSAGVYKPDGTLVRTLWRRVLYGPGTTVRSWDGNDDSGILAEPGSYEIRLLYHNVQYVWDGVIGNTSSDMIGLSPHRGGTFMESLAIDGDNAYYAIGECERFFPVSKFSTSSPQSRTTVVAPDFLTGFDLVATDGARVYVSNGGSTGEQALGPYTTFLIAHKVSDNSNYTFPAGKRVIVNGNGPSTYDSCIDKETYTPPAPTPSPDTRLNPRRPTGLAVQKTGNILAVSHGGLNTIRFFDKARGTLLTQSISVHSPQGLATDSNGDLWVITGTSLQRYSSLSTIPTLVRTITGFSAPIAVAVHPSNPEVVLVADGGDAQIVKAFNRSGQQLWTYGQIGGYSTNGPDVTDTKFEFQVSAKNDPIYRIALAVQSDGSFWVADGATSRLLHINSSHTASIPADTIMFLPHSDVTTVDPNNPTRVIGDGWLEFQVDYSQPIRSGWALRKNWAAGLGSRYFGFGGGVLNVATLNNGRTYAMMRDFSANKDVMVELPGATNTPLRICKTDANTDLYLEPVPAAPGIHDKLRRKLSFEGDGSLRYNQLTTGSVLSWYKQTLTSFDAAGNPRWGTATTIASTPYNVRDPATVGDSVGWQSESVPITSSNIIVSLDNGTRKQPLQSCGPGCTIPADGWHLGGVAVGGNQWRWKGSPALTRQVPMDRLGSFDIGDGVQYAATIAMALGRNAIFDYHGELWNLSEASQFMHFYDDGLFVSQFGTQGIYKHPTGYLLPGFAGGGSHYPSLVGVGPSNEAAVDGEPYLWANDESGHSAVVRWHIVGAKSIREQSGTVSQGGTVALTGTQAPFPTALSAVTGNTQVTLSWVAAAGASSYDVKRSTTNGGPYGPSTIVQTTSNTSATIPGLTNGTAYYFVVSVHDSTTNSNQVQSFPFDIVGIAGQITGGLQWWADYDPPFIVSSADSSMGQPALVGLDNVLGNLTKTNVGTKGYVVYNWGGGGDGNGSTPVPFTVNSSGNCSSPSNCIVGPFTVAVGSGWYNQAHYASSRCLIDNVLGVDSSLNLHSSVSGSIDIHVNDTAIHYLSVFCPTVHASKHDFVIKLTPLGQSSPVASYSTIESFQEGQNHVFQFVFVGNVTLTLVNGNVDEGACLQSLFFD